ncbi:MAG: response regulator transcription factor [Ignavibacteriales bacterium]|nr:response regulator transcription factor [Ignavibacteriales bacterium]
MSQTQVAPTTTDFISVWLIDDNEEFCTVVSAALSETPNIICSECFYSCEAAIESLSHEQQPPDVILLDIGLPGISAIEGIKRLLELSPRSRIIMLTGLNRDENIMRSLAEGASGYLTKSSTAHELIQAIRATIRGGAPMDPFTLQRLLRMFALQGISKSNYEITPKEKEILRLVVSGLTVDEIARNLALSFHTVNTHLKHLYNKLDVHTRSALATKILKERLL